MEGTYLYVQNKLTNLVAQVSYQRTHYLLGMISKKLWADLIELLYLLVGRNFPKPTYSTINSRYWTNWMKYFLLRINTLASNQISTGRSPNLCLMCDEPYPLHFVI